MRLSAPLARLRRDRRGNVLMLFGFALVPITFATGMAIDYGTAMRIQTDLNAAADAAALSATSLSMMGKSVAEAETQARIMFEAHAAGVTGIVPFNFADPAQFQVRVTESSSLATGYQRTATVTYRGQSHNSFAGILGTPTLTVQGSATAQASTAPDTDFYILLDVSSSMALPTTTTGIDFLKSKTVTSDDQSGCAFACHQTNPDNPNIRDANGKITDYYSFAHANNIELRIDAGKTAIADVVTEAETEARSNGAAYRFYLATFDRASNYKALTGTTPTSDFATVRTKASGVQTIAIKKWGSPTWGQQTEHRGSLEKLNADITENPGNGRRVPGDRPKAVLFLITDGMRNEYINGQRLGAIPTDQCDAIKARGVEIAVLYTTYAPETINYDTWSIKNAVGRLPDIAPALKRCASDDLFFEVSTDGSISKALRTLFQRAVQTSRLTR